MAVLPKKVGQFTGNLVTAITGFEADCENFHLCVQYALSNFKYHKFLDVDDHKLFRKVKALCDKLHIHSQPQKADALEQQVKDFSALDSSILKLDTRYSVLSMLLCLAYSPVNAPYDVEDRAPPVVTAASDGDINWMEYLMEGIVIPSFTSDSESEWSVCSEEEVAEEGAILVADLHDTRMQQLKVEDADSALESKMESSCKEERWLCTHVQAPYWLNTLATGINVSEGQIVKETLWLLQGVSASVVYCVTPGGKVAPNPQLQVTHLRQKCLLNCLEFFACYASMLKELASYIASWGGHAFHSPQSPLVSPTLSASTSALNNYLQQLYQVFRKMELSHQGPESNLTLLEVYSSLQGDLPVLTAVANMVSRWKKGMPGWTNAAQASSDVLSVLWTTLREAICASDSKLFAVLLPVWVSTLRPYLGQLGELLWLGKEHSDLGITRNAGIAYSDPEYWTQGFRYTCKADGSLAIPNFLQAVAEPIMSAGKSLALVHSVSAGTAKQWKTAAARTTVLVTDSGSGKPSECAVPISEDQKPSLYKEFTAILSDIVGVEITEGRDSPPAPPLGKANNRETVVFDSSLSMDPVLTSLFNAMTTSFDVVEEEVGGSVAMGCRAEGVAPSHCSCQSCLLRKLANADLPLSVPANILLEQCLHRPIYDRCKEATAALVAVLKGDHDFMQHFSNIQRIFLMEAGETMTHFCAEVFAAIQKGEMWCNASFLNALLLDALQPRLQGLEELYEVQVRDKAQEGPRLTVSLLNRISLQYKVPWSLCIVITAQSLDRYNEIFRFLMQIKWAKWTLESCRVRACHLTGLSDGEQSLAHRMHLLKGRLLHFISSVESYLMTRILHTTGLEFQRTLEQVESLDEIISVHKEYQSLIYDRCLLNPKAQSIKDAITSILTVCLLFAEQWRQRSAVRWSEVCKIESEFSKCSHFLNTILMNSVKRGSFPHCCCHCCALLMSAESSGTGGSSCYSPSFWCTAVESLAFSLSLLEGNQSIFTEMPSQ